MDPAKNRASARGRERLPSAIARIATSQAARHLPCCAVTMAKNKSSNAGREDTRTLGSAAGERDPIEQGDPDVEEVVGEAEEDDEFDDDEEDDAADDEEEDATD